MAYKRLGDMLLESGYITTSQLETALGQQKGSGKRLGEVLIDSGYITEKEWIPSTSCARSWASTSWTFPTSSCPPNSRTSSRKAWPRSTTWYP